MPERIGVVLRRRREAEEYSQEGFADFIGMHRTYYSAIERGKKDMQLSTLEKVCEGLKVPLWVVLREADED